jgi:hypothetical protein
VNPDNGPYWIKDRRVIVLGIGCALAGFMLALLIFGDPWHLPPDWGDIPTWLAVIVASVGGWIALSQLRQQQAVIQADFAQQRKRDDLLDGQLRELADRERSRQREQAEQVTLSGGRVVLASPPDPAGETAQSSGRLQDEPGGSSRVRNNSGRPARRVACRLMLDGQAIMPRRFANGATFAGPGGIAGETMFLPATADDFDLGTGEYLNLLAGREILARFPVPGGVSYYDKATYLIRFTDDAGRRWELDDDMHLAPAPDGDW